MGSWNGDDDGYSHLGGSKLSGHNDFFDMEDDHTDHNVRDIEYKPKTHKKSSAEIARDLIAKEEASKPKPLTLEERNKVIRETQEKHSFQERNAERTAELYAHAAANPVKSSLTLHEVSEKKIQLVKDTGSTVGIFSDKPGSNRVYIKKDRGGSKLKAVNFPRDDFAREIKGKILTTIARQVDLRAVISTAYFDGQFEKEGGSNQRKLADPTGKTSGILSKAMNVVTLHKSMYLGYLSSLGTFLQNPNLSPDNASPNINIHVGNRTVRVNPKWKPLAPRTLEEKANGKSPPTFWKHSGRLAAAFKQSRERHLRLIKDSDFYDKEKLEETMRKFRTTHLNKADQVTPTQRRDSVKFSMDLTIPKWQGSGNGDIMDNLITNPYTRVQGSGKISQFFLANKKQQDYLNDVRERAEASSDLYYANKHIRETHNPIHHEGPKGRASNGVGHEVPDLKQITVKEARNLFYNLHRVGSGYEQKERRFINPEFRRPFIAKLSKDAGIEAMRAMEQLVEKN